MVEATKNQLSQSKNTFGLLSSNQLKIIALIAMTIDHIGYTFFGNVDLFRFVGRIAFPIFAYMIAEGCMYTKNPKKYFGIIFAEGLICQIVYFIAEGSYYMNIFLTFALSIAIIFAYKNAYEKKSLVSIIVFVSIVVFTVFATVLLPKLLYGFEIDYGLVGALTPLAVYIFKNKYLKLISMGMMLIVLGITVGGYQYFGIVALVLLLLYNGERGKMHLKYFFYAYYPIHLVTIYLISLVLYGLL